MRNEAADIVQDHPDETTEWKAKARVAGTATWDATKAAYESMEKKTIEYGQATDKAIRENPYVSAGIAFGLGALLGFIFTRGKDRGGCED